MPGPGATITTRITGARNFRGLAAAGADRFDRDEASAASRFSGDANGYGEIALTGMWVYGAATPGYDAQAHISTGGPRLRR